MVFTAKQIAEFLKGEVVGNPDVKLCDIAKIEEGRPDALSFLSNPKYTQYVYTTNAGAVLVDRDFVPQEDIKTTLIKVDSAYKALSQLLQMVDSMKPKKSGIDSLAFISKSAKIGENAYIAPYAYIGDNVTIGNNAYIMPHAFVGDNVTIGNNVILNANSSIYEGCVVGNNCIIHSAAVIGADGFGFVPNEQGEYTKIPQIGNVIIEDNVEIGAGATIDRATMGSTIIRKGVKIDNLVMIAHNVEVGENTAMAAQSGVAGSCKIGKRCVFAGQVGIAGHLSIADGTIFTAQTGVTNNIKEPNQIWSGSPHMPLGNYRKTSVVYRNLYELQKQLNELTKRINQIELEK